MNESIKTHIKSESQWLRILFMLLFWILLQLTRMVVVIVVLAQILFSLISGQANQNLLEFSASLNQFIYQNLQFLTYNSDDKPFPFADWPASNLNLNQK